MVHTILRLPKVIQQTGLSRSTIYNMVSNGDFPSPIRLGARAVGWVEYDIQAWLAARKEVNSQSLTSTKRRSS